MNPRQPASKTSALPHTPRKRFGQNFLIDRSIISAIIQAINPKTDDNLVEIGPGLGALTQPLLQRLLHLQVIEIDRDLIAKLKKEYPPERLTIHAGDALEFNFNTLGPRLRIAGNLPYNISSPLLFHLITFRKQIHDMHFMLQKEVVDRIVAEPGQAAYSRLSVMLQYYFYTECLLDVPPESFNPAPKVQSAVIRLIPKPHTELTAKDPARLGQIVTAAFSQRRKMLRNTLKPMFSENTLEQLGITPTLRAEELPLGAFIDLANHIDTLPGNQHN